MAGVERCATPLTRYAPLLEVNKYDYGRQGDERCHGKLRRKVSPPPNRPHRGRSEDMMMSCKDRHKSQSNSYTSKTLRSKGYHIKGHHDIRGDEPLGFAFPRWPSPRLSLPASS
jgi:hypothetical protein